MLSDDQLLHFIAQRLLALIDQHGIKSHRDLSLSIGQNENYINIIINEKNYPSVQQLNVICDYFGISLLDFFDGIDDKKWQEDTGARMMYRPPIVEAICQELEQMTPAMLEHIHGIAKEHNRLIQSKRK